MPPNRFSFFALMVCGFLLFSLSGCDSLYRVLQKEGAEEKDLVGDILPFESNPTVEKVQKLLKIYGYAPGRIDGRLGSNTRQAIAKFQSDNGLTPNHFIERVTWEKLNSFAQRDLIKECQVNVRSLQIALQSAGFNPGKVDGKWGFQTLNALKAFQEEEGLKSDGKVGFQTLNKLMAYLPAPKDGSVNEALAAQ